MKRLSRFQTIATTLVMAVAVGAPVVFGQSSGDDGPKHERHGRFGERGDFGGDRGLFGLRGLDLTDAQKAQIKQIHESHRQTIAPLTEQIRARRKEIRQANEGASFNEALVAQKLTEIAPLEAKLMAEQFRVHQETLAVLTPEQKAKLDQQREQFRSRFSERRANKRQKTN